MNLRNLVEFHKENNASITIGSREVETIIPFGVIETKDSNVKRTAKNLYTNIILMLVYI